MPALAVDTLRNAADTRLLIGCAVAARDLNDSNLTAIITAQFNCITPEHDLMPMNLVDTNGVFTFEAGDRVVAFAKAHDLPVIGHMLVWDFKPQKWLFEDAAGKPLPREKALANLKNYIQTVMSHYHGKIQVWNVVNEAISDKDNEYLKDTPALRAIGEDYVERAFEFAHAADPNAELYYNDYNIEEPVKLAKALRLIRSLQAKRVPVNAVGIQGHWLIQWPSTDTIENGIEALAATGLKVMITELDVDPLPRDVSDAAKAAFEKKATLSKADAAAVNERVNPYPDKLPPEMQEKLAERYDEIISAIVRHPVVTMITIWGVEDSRSWLNDFPIKGRTNHPLLFDRDYKPKPALDAVIKALKAEPKGRT